VSEDPTKDIGEKYQTAPTLETVVQMLGELREHMNARFDGVDRRFEAMEIRLDRIESEVKKTHSEFYEMRADFRELRSVVREHFKEPA
jgi:predicted nuclease with TOPRIM domain